VTIKRLESMILDEVINLRSKKLLEYYSDSKIFYNVTKGLFEKEGASLKAGDLFFDTSSVRNQYKVKEFRFRSSLTSNQLVVGQDYDIKLPREKEVHRFRLVEMDRSYDWYSFEAHEPGIRAVAGSFTNLPPVYRDGEGRVDPTDIIVEDKEQKTTELPFEEVKKVGYELDFSASHVFVALG
jgi:hypothetical protein